MDFLIGLRMWVLGSAYRWIARPLIFLWLPEVAHDKLKFFGKILGSNPVTIFLTKLLFSYRHRALNINVDGVNYDNPVGLSAGFDKDGELTNIYPAISFGLAELGSFTGDVCPGNPGVGRRLFRMPKSKSILVWYGLNNQGADRISARLKGAEFKLRIGISAAKTNESESFVLDEAIEDYVKTVVAFADIGDYYTINISCPNTQEGEPFASKDNLDKLLARLVDVRPENKPMYVKLAADLPMEEVDLIVDSVVEHGLEGVVMTNLAKPQYNDEYVKEELPFNKGALSGLPVQRISTNMIRHVYRRTRGKITIIGVGGIFNAADAYEKITSGASLVQMITGMIYQGPQVMGEINRGLVKLMKADGFDSLEQAVGSRVALPKESGVKLNQ